MRNRALENERKRSRVIPVAMILFGLTAVLVGVVNPQTPARPPQALTQEQLELVRADHIAGYPASSLPDNPPRGPGA